MRILVLGGTVFLGRHVAAAALARGHERDAVHPWCPRHGSVPGGDAARRRPRRRPISARGGRVGRGDRHVGLRARPRRAACASCSPTASATTCSSPAATPIRAGRRSTSTRTRRPGRPTTRSTGRRRQPASGRRGRAAGPVRDRARRTDLRAARQHVPAPLVGEADRGRRTRACAGRPGAAGAAHRRARSRATGCSISASSTSRARSTGRHRRARRRWARCSRRRWPRPGRAPSSSGSPTSGCRLASRAVGGAPAVDPCGGVPGHLDDRDRAGTGVRSSCRPIAKTVADVWTWLRDGGEDELDEWRSEHRPPPMAVDREDALLGSPDARFLSDLYEPGRGARLARR